MRWAKCDTSRLTRNDNVYSDSTIELRNIGQTWYDLLDTKDPLMPSLNTLFNDENFPDELFCLKSFDSCSIPTNSKPDIIVEDGQIIPYGKMSSVSGFSFQIEALNDRPYDNNTMSFTCKLFGDINWNFDLNIKQYANDADCSKRWDKDTNSEKI